VEAVICEVVARAASMWEGSSAALATPGRRERCVWSPRPGRDPRPCFLSASRAPGRRGMRRKCQGGSPRLWGVRLPRRERHGPAAGSSCHDAMVERGAFGRIAAYSCLLLLGLLRRRSLGDLHTPLQDADLKQVKLQWKMIPASDSLRVSSLWSRFASPRDRWGIALWHTRHKHLLQAARP